MAMNPRDRPTTERRPPAAPSHTQTMMNIGLGFLPIERSKVVPHRDPLPQLPQFGPIQRISQFGLPDQDDLQQFSVVGFQIGQEANLLEEVLGHVLRLVDEQDDINIVTNLLQKIGIEPLKQLGITAKFQLGSGEAVVTGGARSQHLVVALVLREREVALVKREVQVMVDGVGRRGTARCAAP